MSLVDTNVLVYAVDPLSTHHARANRWLDSEISSGRKVYMPWLALIGFIRLTTQRATATNPLPADDALAIVRAWTGNANVICPHPDSQHLDRVAKLLAATAAGGNLVNDAHLAALAIQHEAAVVSFDNDFSRFPDVRWLQPG